MPENVRAAIREFIRPKFPDAQWRDDEDLFTFGLIDSLTAMELVMFLERRFGLQIPNAELDVRNFRTVDAMAALVDRLTDRADGHPTERVDGRVDDRSHAGGHA